MVAVSRRLYTQADYDCQRCGAPETEAMAKRVRDFIRPYCDPCSEAMKHEAHGPGSGLLCHHSVTRVRQVPRADGTGVATVEEVERLKTIPIEESPTRCRVCFAKDYP